MRNRRLWFLVVILVGVIAAWGATFVENLVMEHELSPIAKDLEADSIDRMKSLTTQPVDVTSAITAARDHVLYGQAMGKIAVYVAVEREPGRYTYQGIEYHYVKDHGAWKMTDSGACTAADCLETARAAFGYATAN